MTWETYKTHIREGNAVDLEANAVEVRVLLGLLPSRYRWPLVFIVLLEWIAVLGSLYLTFTHKWFAFIPGFIIWLAVLVPAKKKTVRQFILEYAADEMNVLRLM